MTTVEVLGREAIYTLRLTIDSLIALLLVCILASVVYYHRDQRLQAHQYRMVHLALAQLHEQALFRGALLETKTGQAGFPRDIGPSWFAAQASNESLRKRIPTNTIVPRNSPWLDIAPPGDNSDHPPDPIIASSNQAGFWYNPSRGIFRARVAPQYSEQQTLRLYNLLNGTVLTRLENSDVDERRPNPVQLNPGALAATNPRNPIN